MQGSRKLAAFFVPLLLFATSTLGQSGDPYDYETILYSDPALQGDSRSIDYDERWLAVGDEIGDGSFYWDNKASSAIIKGDGIFFFYQSPLWNGREDAEEEGVAWAWTYDVNPTTIEFIDTGFDKTISSIYINRASWTDAFFYRFEGFKTGVDMGNDCWPNDEIQCNTRLQYFGSLIVQGCEPWTAYTGVDQTGDSACFYPTIVNDQGALNTFPENCWPGFYPTLPAEASLLKDNIRSWRRGACDPASIEIRPEELPMGELRTYLPPTKSN